MGDSAIICDKVIDAEAEAKLNNKAKTNEEETKKKSRQILMKRKQPAKRKIYVFYLCFY